MENKRRKLTKAHRKIVYDKTNGRCAYCGCELEINNFHVDHIKSIKIYGQDADVIDNMYPSCKSCNLYKHTLSVEDFRKELSKISIRLQRNISIYGIAKRYGIVVECNKDIEFYFERIEENGK